MRPNQQRSAAWNGPESAHYVDHADRYDRQLAPITEVLLGMGIVRGLLSGLDESQRRSAIQAVGIELERRHQPGVGVGLGAAVWLVAARLEPR